MHEVVWVHGDSHKDCVLSDYDTVAAFNYASDIVMENIL
jgi:hypothetical protein